MTGRIWRPVLHDEGPADAPVLVLGHSLGSSRAMWDEVVAHLSARVRVIRHDLPGHGDSPLLDGGSATMARLRDGLLAGLDDLGVGRFHAAGLSFGGMGALALAEAVPDRVASLAVMASGARNGNGTMWAQRAALVRSEGTSSIAAATMERWFTLAFREDADGSARVARIRASFEACHDEGYAQVCEVLGTTDLTDGLDRVRAHVLVVNGSDDAFDDAAADALAAAMVSAASTSVLHLPGRHMCAVEHPSRVAEALLALIDRAGAR